MRTVETRLAYTTLAILPIYVVLETYVSLPYGLLNPFYIIDAIAMLLLGWGAMHSLKARPRPAPGIMAAAFAWTAANGWRATFDRVYELRQGGTLDYGSTELITVACSTACTLGVFVFSLFLVVRSNPPR